MPEFDVSCSRCGVKLTHDCHADLVEAAQRIYEYVPEGYNVDFTKLPGYEKGDEDAPFFSEAFLYVLMGKGDARVITAIVDNVIRAAGLDPSALRQAAHEKRVTEEKELKRRVEAMNRIKARRQAR